MKFKNELTPFPPDFWSNGTMVICWNPVDMYSNASPRKFQSDLQSNILH